MQISSVFAFLGPASVRALQTRVSQCSVHKVHRRAAAASLALLHKEKNAVPGENQ